MNGTVKGNCIPTSVAYVLLSRRVRDRCTGWNEGVFGAYGLYTAGSLHLTTVDFNISARDQLFPVYNVRRVVREDILACMNHSVSKISGVKYGTLDRELCFKDMLALLELVLL